MSKLINPCIAALLAFELLTFPARADLAKGLDAVMSGHWSAALAEFKPLANQGDPDAQVNLGNLYMRGLGVEQDYGTALSWYEKAAHQGHPTGQSKLAVMLYYGLGVKENHAEAAQWFLKAAERGDPSAAMVIAELYEKADGIPASKIDAYVWFSIAADLGKEDALSQRAHLANALSPNEMNTALTRLNVWRGEHDRPEGEGLKSERKAQPESTPRASQKKSAGH